MRFLLARLFLALGRWALRVGFALLGPPLEVEAPPLVRALPPHPDRVYRFGLPFHLTPWAVCAARPPQRGGR